MSALKRTLLKPIQEFKDLCAAWTKFWFEPQDVATVALLRLLAGGMILYTHIIWGLRLESYFSSNGWQPALVVDNLREGASFWSFWWYVPDDMLWPAHIVCLVILAMFFVGLWTPLTSKLAFGIVVSYAHRVPLANYGLDQINGFLSLYLALAPCGRVASVDWLLRRRREAKRSLLRGKAPAFSKPAPSPWARLTTRLIQIQLCVLYTYAGIAKLKGTAWWEGDAIWIAAGNLEYQSNSLVWLAWMAPFAEFLTHATILWECTFWALVWPLRTRPYVLFIGGMMHLGIGAFMGMWTFGLIMTFAYQAFTPPQLVRDFAARLWSVVMKPRTISFVPAEAGRLSWMAAFDANNVLQFEQHPELAALESRPDTLDDDHTSARPAALLPATWSEAVKACPPAVTGNNVLYVDANADSQSHALTNFTKHGLRVRVASDWPTARLLRAISHVDIVVVNVANLSADETSAIEQDLATDDHVSAVVLTTPSGQGAWVRSGDIVLAGLTSLRNVRVSVESLLDQMRESEQASTPAQVLEVDQAALTDTDSELDVSNSSVTPPSSASTHPNSSAASNPTSPNDLHTLSANPESASNGHASDGPGNNGPVGRTYDEEFITPDEVTTRDPH